MKDREQTVLQPSRSLYFWDDCVLYVGPGMPATVHAHQAVQVCIPLSGSVRLRPGPGSRWREYAAAAIAPDQPHESDVAVDLLATLWLDPGRPEARVLTRCRASRGITALEREALEPLLPGFLECWRDLWEPTRTARLVSQVLRSLPASRPELELDPRIARVARISRSTRSRRWLPELAAAVALSPSRLEHLFSSEMGVPMQRYLLWQRLRRAVQELADGSSVTHAAHSAGFSDTAHLSRTFRRLLGFTPSSAFRLQVSRFVQA
jgi:AraC family transcriptional regulator